MIEDTGTPLENWVTRLKNDSKEMFRGSQFCLGPFRLATTQALMLAYGGKVNANLMVRTLREAGIEKVVPKDLDGGSAGRNQLRIGNRPHTVWALEPGIKMTSDEIRKAYFPLTKLEAQLGTGWAIREPKDWSKQ
jgi:hypothetical protein